MEMGTMLETKGQAYDLSLPRFNSYHHNMDT